MYQILVCDETKALLSELEEALRTEGFQVLYANSSEDAVSIIRHKDVHLVLLDDSLPNGSALVTISAIRALTNVPIILFSDSRENQEIIFGLNAGADDYVHKPFHDGEIIARINSLLRRYMQLGCRTHRNMFYEVGGLSLNDQTKKVAVDGTEVSLTPLEYDILALLIKNPGHVFSSKEIYRLVWNAAPMGAENAVAVHIRHIREKIEKNPAQPIYLRVVWGKGYKVILED